jgi:hypothetical protein
MKIVATNDLLLLGAWGGGKGCDPWDIVSSRLPNEIIDPINWSRTTVNRLDPRKKKKMKRNRWDVGDQRL